MKVKTEFNPNNFCIDDVLDYVKAKKKAMKKDKHKEKSHDKKKN